MATTLYDLYRQNCLGAILQGLQAASGQPKEVVTDMKLFKQYVIDPSWNLLPVNVRSLGRDKLRWDEFFLTLRVEAFLNADEKIQLKPDVLQKLDSLTTRMFSSGAVPIVPTPAPVPVAPQPLRSMPVPAAPVAPIPVRPVQAVPVQAVPVQAIPVQAMPVSTPVKAKIARPAIPLASATRSSAPRSSAPTAVQPRTGVRVPQQPASTSNVAIGIDLGTTYSVVAHIDAHGRPVSVPNAVGDIVTPSVILFDDGGPVVGKEAVMAAAMEPERIADVVKRDMGSKFYRKKIRGESLPPEVISSIILRALKEDAERKLGPVSKAVITVPAYFDEARRRSTIDAGKLAGLEVLDIINEPTAAAIAYGHQLGFLDATGRSVSSKPLRVLVYDLGGGTFDVTIVEIQGSSFKAIATDGDVALGGKDFDEQLVNFAAEQFIHVHREDPRLNPNSLQELWNAAETVKKTLTERTKATMYVNHLGARHKVDITREQFEEMTLPLLGRTQTTTEIVVRQAGLRWADIDKVLLVGGSTRMPMVARQLEAMTGRPPERSMAVDEAVAHGAALYANLLLQAKMPTSAPPQFSVTNVNSHSLGIIGIDPATGRRKNQILIPKNTPLPTTVTKVFKTNKANQPNVVIRVVEGESERPEACIQVGVATIDNLPRNLPAGTPVQVSYSYLTNGQLRVTGQVAGQSTGASTVFQRENAMPDEEIEMWSQFLSVDRT